MPPPAFNPPLSISEPNLYDVLANWRLDLLAGLNCLKVGQIQTFDRTKKTATVGLLFKRVLADGTIQSYPLLLDCPVFTLQGGGGSLQFPIAPGDQCLVLFSDRNLDAWFQNGAAAPPLDGRLHDLSDGIALVGVNALNSSLPPYSATESRLQYGGAKIGLQGGLVTVRSNTQSLLTVLQNLVTTLQALTTTGGDTVSAASQAALGLILTELLTLLY